MRLKKILFLDIDGVLTSRFDDSFLFECDPSNYNFSSRCLKNLDKIIEETRCKILVSSSWRNYPDNHVFINRNGQEYTSLLPNLRKMYKDVIVGNTMHSPGKNKFEDISKHISYIKKTFKPQYKFVVLDDDPSQELQNFNDGTFNDVRWFKTSIMYGLDDLTAEAVIDYFNE